jgi:uncharacterized protein involved in exopolysaccharide biosynthesis
MRDYLETFFRRKWLFFVPFLAALIIAGAGGVYTSWLYEVQARMIVQGNPVLDGAGQQLSMPVANATDEYTALTALLQTDDFLRKVIDGVPSLKGDGDPARMDAAIAKLRKDLNAWTSATSLINFRYRDRDPQTAQQVVSRTIDLFIAQRNADRVGDADKAITFLSAQQTSYQQQLQQASTELSAWEQGHPPAGRANLPEAEQLNFQRLQTNYQTILDHLKYVGSELEKARFTKDKAVALQAGTYQIVDPPVVPQNPALSVNKLAGVLLIGLVVAAGLGFSVVALVTWFGGRRAADSPSALPPWLNRMMAQEEQTA